MREQYGLTAAPPTPVTATDADHAAMREALAIWERRRGPLPPNVHAVRFDESGHLARVGLTGACVCLDNDQVAILVVPGRPAKDVRATLLHELQHASDWLIFGRALAADRDAAEFRAESFARRWA